MKSKLMVIPIICFVMFVASFWIDNSIMRDVGYIGSVIGLPVGIIGLKKNANDFLVIANITVGSFATVTTIIMLILGLVLCVLFGESLNGLIHFINGVMQIG